MKISASTEIMGDVLAHSLSEDFIRAADDFAAMQQEHQAALLAENCNDLLPWQQSREMAFKSLAQTLERVVACGEDNKECIVRAQKIMEELLAKEDVLQKLIMARQLEVQEQLLAMRKGKEVLQGYNINKGLVPRPSYLSNKL
ncbi:MAG: hypothetical protein NT087_10935 [Deltaproteobacteria bacterium]|nr:hypothetical protein [Deltaproteobacteria bacterium]